MFRIASVTKQFTAAAVLEPAPGALHAAILASTGRAKKPGP